ncbi:MAG: hypothetical protein KJ072_03110 [Verrucomicrobia bacterium]|nr:hypothetical protein [Verrucomicrobiota bacterium]
MRTDLNSSDTAVSPVAADSAQASLSAPPPQVPDHQLLRKIGGGSYGEVWLARNTLGTLRAIKIVYRHIFEDNRPFEREFRGIQRFEPLSRTHEGLVDILQVGSAQDYFYYVMELADPIENPNSESRNPREIRNPQSPIPNAELCERIADGLTAALSQVPGLKLAPRKWAYALTDKEPDPLRFANARHLDQWVTT